MLIISRKAEVDLRLKANKLGCAVSLFDLTDPDRRILAEVKVVRIERDQVKIRFWSGVGVCFMRRELTERGVHRDPLLNEGPGGLVLGRRLNELVDCFLDQQLIAEVKVVFIEGGVVKLGIQADRDRIGIVRDDAAQEHQRWIDKNPLTPPSPSPTPTAAT